MSARPSIDLNADVGEGFAEDAELIPLVTSANIACGAHAGDRETMAAAVRLCLAHGTAVGAHPGFADREHFGRRELSTTPGEAAALVADQVHLLESVAGALGARVAHVKLHGALYNLASRDAALAAAIARALAAGRPRVLVALAGSALERAGRQAGLAVVGEAFVERAYRADGLLAARSLPGAVVEDEGAAAAQAVALATVGRIRSLDGPEVAIDAGTLCIHGDRPGAARLARRVRAELGRAGVAVAAFAAPGPTC